MKFKHFLVLTVVFALVALGTSCSKPSENKIIGKWQLVSLQYHSSANPDQWQTETPDPDEVNVIEFRNDGNCLIYENGEIEDSGKWSLDKENEKLIIDGEAYDITKLTSKEMVLNVKVTIGEGWIEEQVNLKKVK